MDSTGGMSLIDFVNQNLDVDWNHVVNIVSSIKHFKSYITEVYI